MAIVIPFKGVRPAKDKVHLVGSRSVDIYSKNDLSDKLKGNPFTFLHVLHPDFDDGIHTIPGSPERLLKTKAKYEEFHHKEIFISDPTPCYYIYRQHKDGYTYTGLIACTSIDDYFNGVIKIHEEILDERAEKLKSYLEICDFNAEPVLFTYPNNSTIDAITKQITAKVPEYDYSTTDYTRHTVWVVNDPEEIALIAEGFRKIQAIYIADGHHRSASSALLGKSRREENPNFTGNEPYNFYLGAFFPESELKIFDYNRVVTDMNGLYENEFLQKLEYNFNVELKGEEIYKPTCKHNFSIYYNSKWYSLTPRQGVVNDLEPVNSLDASILTKLVLSPILGIGDLKHDNRVSFVPGFKGMAELKNIVDNSEAKIAFGLYPVEMKQLKHIADTNNIMPPKTTWVEPKMRSGLLIYSLAE